MSIEDVNSYEKVKEAILQTPNLSSEAYWCQLCEIGLGADYQHRMIVQKG